MQKKKIKNKKETINKKTEKIPLLLVYKDNNQFKTDISRDVNEFELFGFLKLYVERLGENLKDDIVPREDGEDIL